jgi:hypothetical protein
MFWKNQSPIWHARKHSPRDLFMKHFVLFTPLYHAWLGLVATAVLCTSMMPVRAAPPVPVIDTSTTYDDEPITGDDIKEMLDLRATKHRVSFDKPKAVKVLIEVLGQQPIEVDLPGPCKHITIMTYVPDRADQPERLKMLYYWIKDDRGSGQHSYFPYDATRAKHRRSGVDNGIFTIKASYNSEFKDKPTYQFTVITKDVK